MSDKMKISHILVNQEYEAQDLLRKLREGHNFEDLAKKFSTCPSKSNGGSLGDVELRRLVEPFAEAAKKLAPGELSIPVRTQFGYHIIRHDT